jgi:prolipoprotein diacylglyceryltransferase
MHQVLIRIPLKPFAWLPDWWPEQVPLFGYGMMLFITFLVTTWLAGRRARKEGMNPQHVQDLGIWIFAAGIIGARITFMIQYKVPIQDFFKIWEGGLVFYGSAIGGVVGYALAYWFIIRPHGLSTWKIADAVAPAVAIGLCLGRVGCLLNGCCYGNVACPNCPAIHFPMSAPPRAELVQKGLQTAAGFAMAGQPDQPPATVQRVEPESPAAASGLKVGDVITRIETRLDGQAGEPFLPAGLRRYLVAKWPVHGPALENVALRLTVRREGKSVDSPWFNLPPAAKPGLLDFGFTTANCTVGEVNPDAPAYQSGLRTGDLIVRANDHPINFYEDLDSYLGQGEGWVLGQTKLRLAVAHAGSAAVADLQEYEPRTLGLHPTQVYESISMALLLWLLLAFSPFKGRDGMVMVLFLFGYAIHRFLNEMLRNDTEPVAFNMTLSQNGSVLVFILALALMLWIWRKPAPEAVKMTA